MAIEVEGRCIGGGARCLVFARLDTSECVTAGAADQLVGTVAAAGADGIVLGDGAPAQLEELSTAAAACRRRGLLLLATARDVASLDAFSECGVTGFSIPDSAVPSHELLVRACHASKLLLVTVASTDISDVARTVSLIRRSGAPPTVLVAAAADTLRSLRGLFHFPVGWASDVTSCAYLAGAAAGADVLEARFTTADEFRRQIATIRLVESGARG